MVTKDVEPYTIVGGVPARPIRRRFDEATVAELRRMRWWDWELEKIRRAIPFIQRGDVSALRTMEEDAKVLSEMAGRS